MFANEINWGLDQKPCSSLTNDENVAAWNGGYVIRKRDILRQCWSMSSIIIVLEKVDNNKILIDCINNPLCILLFNI